MHNPGLPTLPQAISLILIFIQLSLSIYVIVSCIEEQAEMKKRIEERKKKADNA